MAGFWPLYSNFVSLSQVTLALPGIPSAISKSVGGKSPALLLVPNVDFLIAFIQGNIGIADSMSQAALMKNLNGPIAANDEMVARHFSKVNKLGLEEKMDQYKQGKKIKIPKSDIAVSPENGFMGFKAIEKAVLQSIFETQKPYMEIAKMVIDVLVSIEDIVARIMPLISASPLTAKSDKPVGNAGSGKRPKAIGYQGGKEIKAAIAALDKLSKIGGKLTVNKDGTTKGGNEEIKKGDTSEGASDLSLLNNEKLKDMGKQWKIVDVVYSTGMYDPKIDYLYTYIDLPADDGLEGKQADDEAEPEDPYEKYKPKRIILGIFDSKGVPLNPMDTLYTINQSFDPGRPDDAAGKTKTNFAKADWVTRSPKWVFPKSTSPGATVWPTFGTPTYRWKGTGVATGQTRESKDKPGAIVVADSVVGDWEIKKYKKGDKNEQNGFDAIEGDPIIVGFDASDINAYTSYFAEYANINMRLAKDLDEKEKAEATSTIMGQLNVKSHLENVSLYAPGKSSVYKNFSIPQGMKLAFKPMQITVDAAKADPNLAGLDGKIWIDPESDYETKIIEVKPVTKIAYSEAKGAPDVKVDIQSFVKNKAIFKFKNGEKFSMSISKNSAPAQTYLNMDQYVLENWNYDPATRRISSNNSYRLRIWSDKPEGKAKELLASGRAAVMGRGTSYTKHGSYEIVITPSGSDYLYAENEYVSTGTASNSSAAAAAPAPGATASNTTPRTVSDGIKKLGDGTIVEVKAKKIVKWYFAYDALFNDSNLPAFGQEASIAYDFANMVIDARDIPGTNIDSFYVPKPAIASKGIPLYQVKVANNDFPFGKVIEPDKIMNDQLTRDELYSTGRYGTGSDDLPQELGTVYRYAKTDLDTETYYIIEGIRPDLNLSGGDTGGDRAGSNSSGSAKSGAGGGQYRLPHAIGAITVFIKMLVKIFSKLIPSIVKLLKLFKNPMGFVTDIIMTKLGESFSCLSPEAMKKFENAEKLMKEKKKYQKPVPPAQPGQPAPVALNMGDYVKRMRSHFQDSPLANYVAVDSLGNFKDAKGKIPKSPPKDAIGNFKFVYDGVGYIPFTIFGKDLSFGMELKMANVITKEWGNRKPMKLIFNKEKNSADDGNVKAGGQSADTGSNADAKADAKAAVDTNAANNAGLDQGSGGSKNPNKRYVTISTWYSTGEFINGVDYKYVYIDQDEQALLDEVDKLAASEFPDDLQEAKRKLEEAQSKNPDSEAIADKLADVNKKLFDLNSNTQPLLKFILGLVTLPIKVIAGVVEWIMNFFKSLTNPMTLPKKIIEFLSFKWIMDFFSPKGLLKLAGIEFDLSLIPGWIAAAKQTGSQAKAAAADAKAKAEGAKGKADAAGAAAKDAKSKAKDANPADAKAAAAEKTPPLPKGVPKHGGPYALPDDYLLVDLPKFLNVAFLAQLPKYTVRDIREQGKNIPLRLFLPIICFIEKLINGFIDFVWSILGIECIIPPPHIKLCKDDDPEGMSAEELAKTLAGLSPSGGGSGATASDAAGAKTEVAGTNPFTSQTPPLERYVYEVKLESGEVKRFLDRESLDRFMEENREIGFDVQF
jgi:hypothetical protein